MESLKQRTDGTAPGLRRKCNLRRPWHLALLVAAIIVVILVIVIPLAVILPKKHEHKGKPSTVLFPAYIYPETNSTWGPLYQAITTYPDLNFVVIVNPSSGPGSSPSPSMQYAVAVRRLNSYSNVQSVGYVRTNYASRNISAVLADVETYSNWASQSTSLAMDGIFFDEIPYDYTSEKAEYLSRINEAVKAAIGIQSERMVIHNPGTIPDSRYDMNTTDVTVVFEQSYDNYEAKQQVLAETFGVSDRGANAYMLHSVPTMTNSSLTTFVDDLSKRASYLYLTARNTDIYESFNDSRLEQFCSVVPTKHKK